MPKSTGNSHLVSRDQGSVCHANISQISKSRDVPLPTGYSILRYGRWWNSAMVILRDVRFIGIQKQI